MQRIKASDLPTPTESEEQQALFRYCAVEMTRFPELEMLAHIPNEGKRTNAAGARLKREGLRKGYPDIVLNVPHGGYHGLFIELKRQRSGRTTPEQKEWIAKLIKQGYAAAFCYGWEDAWTFIHSYMTCDKNVNTAKTVREYIARGL